MRSRLTFNMADGIIDTWNIHARIVLYVLDAVAAEALSAHGATKGRTVGEDDFSGGFKNVNQFSIDKFSGNHIYIYIYFIYIYICIYYT